MPMRVNPRQVGGVFGDTIKSDIMDMADKARSYDRPVPTSTDLPLEGNQDGDVRLVLDENRFYIWDEPTNDWYPDEDHMTEARTHKLDVVENRQTNFNTLIPVGSDQGIASLDTIMLLVNGMLQHRGVDYVLGVTALSTPTLIVDWISSDFELEMDDTVQVNYDKLIIK